MPPRLLKNIEGPVPLFRPFDASLPCGGVRPTVGRVAGLRALCERLDALESGGGGLVVVEGEPGIGKSQLVDDLIARAASRRFATMVGRADAIDRTTPYHAWRPLFSSLLDLDEDSGTTTRGSRLIDRVLSRPELLRLAPLLNSILLVDLAENELTGQMTGQVRADNTNDLLLRLLHEIADRGPTVLILEDAHWFDSSSWALAVLAARSLPRTLIVVTARGPDEASFPGEYRKFLQLPGAARLHLDALSAEDSLTLACRRLGVDSLPPQAADLIIRKAQGNPFFSEELAFALRDSRLLLIEGRQCRVAPGVDLDAVSIPDRVDGVVHGRVDRLSPSEQLALKVASVIGRLFAVKLLREVYPIEPERDRLPAYLDSLARLELILPEDPEPELAYLFRHVITREVVYDLMPFAQRRQLHRAVAEWFERVPDTGRTTDYPRLAYHWGHAGDDVRAIDALEKAAELALNGGAIRRRSASCPRPYPATSPRAPAPTPRAVPGGNSSSARPTSAWDSSSRVASMPVGPWNSSGGRYPARRDSRWDMPSISPCWSSARSGRLEKGGSPRRRLPTAGSPRRPIT